MRLDFPNHGLYRVFVDRNIDIDDVKRIVRNPERTAQQENGNMVAYGVAANGKRLRVVYVSKSKQRKVIVTAFYEN